MLSKLPCCAGSEGRSNCCWLLEAYRISASTCRTQLMMVPSRTRPAERLMTNHHGIVINGDAAWQSVVLSL